MPSSSWNVLILRLRRKLWELFTWCLFYLFIFVLYFYFVSHCSALFCCRNLSQLQCVLRWLPGQDKVPHNSVQCYLDLLGKFLIRRVELFKRERDFCDGINKSYVWKGPNASINFFPLGRDSAERGGNETDANGHPACNGHDSSTGSTSLAGTSRHTCG